MNGVASAIFLALTTVVAEIVIEISVLYLW